MIGINLLKSTNAYKIFLSDKKSNCLSHAYLIVCDDEDYIENYLIDFAKTLMCSKTEACNECRSCKLIDSKNFTDAVFYPSGKKIVVSDVDDLVEKSYYKPLESDKKVFILKDISTMTVQAQNKLLKTLEEPPENTYILMGTTTVYPVLSTILSRCKKLEIGGFSESDIVRELSGEYQDVKALKRVAGLSGGKVGEVVKRMQNDDGKEAEDLACSVLLNLKSSSEVANYSAKITKDMLRDFVSSLARIIQLSISKSLYKKAVIPENLTGVIEEISTKIDVGALIYISDKIRTAEKSLSFNGNVIAVVDGLLFGILEGKFKYGNDSRG
jgi:DNA polymerase-3 subunit delta'